MLETHHRRYPKGWVTWHGERFLYATTVGRKSGRTRARRCASRSPTPGAVRRSQTSATTAPARCPVAQPPAAAAGRRPPRQSERLPVGLGTPGAAATDGRTWPPIDGSRLVLAGLARALHPDGADRRRRWTECSCGRCMCAAGLSGVRRITSRTCSGTRVERLRSSLRSHLIPRRGSLVRPAFDCVGLEWPSWTRTGPEAPPSGGEFHRHRPVVAVRRGRAQGVLCIKGLTIRPQPAASAAS